MLEPDEKLILISELASDSNCDIQGCNKRAINTIIQPMSFKVKITLNICENCFNSLYNKNYLLFWCFGCGQAIWIDKKSRHWGKYSNLKNYLMGNIVYFEYCNLCYEMEKIKCLKQ